MSDSNNTDSEKAQQKRKQYINNLIFPKIRQHQNK